MGIEQIVERKALYMDFDNEMSIKVMWNRNNTKKGNIFVEVKHSTCYLKSVSIIFVSLRDFFSSTNKQNIALANRRGESLPEISSVLIG